MESKITYHSDGVTTFSGPDAIAVFHAAALRAGLGLMEIGIKPHRTWTSLKKALEQATRYTGNKYRGKHDIERARADLDLYVQTKKAELS